MNCIERYFDGYGEVKRWWLRNLQQYYVFFYEKKGGKVRGVLGISYHEERFLWGTKFAFKVPLIAKA